MSKTVLQVEIWHGLPLSLGEKHPSKFSKSEFKHNYFRGKQC